MSSFNDEGFEYGKDFSISGTLIISFVLIAFGGFYFGASLVLCVQYCIKKRELMLENETPTDLEVDK